MGICIFCHRSDGVRNSNDITLHHNGVNVTIHNCISYTCNFCLKEYTTNEDDIDKGKKIVAAIQNIEGFLTSDQIYEIRQALDISKKEMALELNVPIEIYNLYESGLIVQTKSANNYLMELQSMEFDIL